MPNSVLFCMNWGVFRAGAHLLLAPGESEDPNCKEAVKKEALTTHVTPLTPPSISIDSRGRGGGGASHTQRGTVVQEWAGPERVHHNQSPHARTVPRTNTNDQTTNYKQRVRLMGKNTGTEVFCDLDCCII